MDGAGPVEDGAGFVAGDAPSRVDRGVPCEGQRTKEGTASGSASASQESGGRGQESGRNEFRERIEQRVRVLRSLRQPTVEQIERAQFWEEYLRTPAPGPRALHAAHAERGRE